MTFKAFATALTLAFLTPFTQGANAIFIDNDGDAAALDRKILRGDISADELLHEMAILPTWEVPFEDVIGYLTPDLQKHFDTFIFVNSSTDTQTQSLVPGQHMLVVQRTQPGEILKVGQTVAFKNVQALNPAVRSPRYPNTTLFPTSTGNGSGIRTFSGIYTFDHARNGWVTNVHAPMSYFTTLRFYYSQMYERSGRQTGVAIHGVPDKEQHNLGVQRSSHGCMRNFRDNAMLLFPLLNQAGTVPLLDYTSQTADIIYDAPGQPRMTTGSKALVIIFNGYRNPIYGT